MFFDEDKKSIADFFIVGLIVMIIISSIGSLILNGTLGNELKELYGLHQFDSERDCYVPYGCAEYIDLDNGESIFIDCECIGETNKKGMGGGAIAFLIIIFLVYLLMTSIFMIIDEYDRFHVIGWISGHLFFIFFKFSNIRFSFPSILIWIGIWLIIAELYFLIFDKEKPQKKDWILKFTGKRKLWSLGISIIVTIVISFIFNIFKDYWKQILTVALWIVSIIGALAVIAGILYGYLWLNSLKYKKKK